MTISEQFALRDRYRHPTGAWHEFKATEVEQSIVDRFEEQVKNYPERLAVKHRDSTLSYAQLNQMANSIAHTLHNDKTEGEERKPIGILLDNAPPMIAAILGVLKAGRPYVPLDPSFPQERLAYYLSNSGSDLILTDEDYREDAVALAKGDCQILEIDQIDDALLVENPSIVVNPDAIAYIYYTSGSTGQPKGVYNSHRSLLHQIRRNTNTFCFCPEDRLICLKSLSFAGALKDIFGPLLNGASLHLYSLKRRGISSLGKWLIDNKITLYNSVATVFRQLIGSLETDIQFPDLRIIYFGGERIKPSDIAAYQQHFAQHTLLSLGLGSTETGPVTRLYIDKSTRLVGDVVPTGYPTEDIKLMILDDEGESVAASEAGQIVIKSSYLSLGYWHAPEQTAAKFVPTPKSLADDPSLVDHPIEKIYFTGDTGYLDEHGCLYHLGRKDYQVKIRGYRVGLEEVETALLKHPIIQEGTIVAKALHTGEQGLVAYYVLASEEMLTTSALRNFLSDKLPDYMIPSLFVQLDSFPTLPNGKVDIKALSAPDRSRPNLEILYVKPRSAQEKILGTLWSKILCIDQVGIHDDFFDLGGQSILMMELVTAVEKAFEVELNISEFLEEPTIAALAIHIAQQ